MLRAMALGVVAAAVCAADGDVHRRILPNGEHVEDARAVNPRHTDTVFTMPQFESVAAWESFAEELRRRILVGCGLFPTPERTPLKAVIKDVAQHDDYSVANVYFEAYPGFYVTGNLYKPAGAGPYPAILNPHGHWEAGRFEDGERGSVPARCITFARMGIVTLSIDMLGYNDSMQFEHRWADEKLKLWGIHPFALQLWSSIRAVDFLEELPYVDRTRIGCTGASGGGTQTFALTAVDDRIKAAAPVNMVSSTMQGGCVCENAPLIRLRNSNMEIAALMAPRPMLMVSATGDWTRETPRIEFPAVRSIYELYDAAHRLSEVQIKAGHNYNQASREAVYPFMERWLQDRDTGPVAEPEYTIEPVDSLRVFPNGVMPNETPTDEELIAAIVDATRDKWLSEFPHDGGSLEEFRRAYRPAFQSALGVEIPGANELAPERLLYEEQRDYVLEHWVLGRARFGDRIPAIFYRSREVAPQPAVLIVHGGGKAALADAAGPGGLVQRLVADGKAVLVIDAFLTGESPAQRERVGEFHDTFNLSDTACRVQDVLTAAAWVRSRRDLMGAPEVIGLDEAGVWALFAAAVDTSIDRVVADLNGFNPEDDAEWAARYYVPSIRALGDLHTAAALVAPRPLAIVNTADRFDARLARRAYQSGSANTLHIAADASSPQGLAALLR